MRSALWPVALVLGIAFATLIMLVGPLLLFNPIFTSLLQARHDVPAQLGVGSDAVQDLTASYLADLFLGGDFGAVLANETEPFLVTRERAHMEDVSRLVRILAVVALAAAATAVGTLMLLRREPARIGRVMLFAAGGIGSLALVLAIVFAVAFEPAFLAFHQLLFPPGTYLFGPDSDLIRLFPQGFWFDASLAAGASILIGAMIVALIGLRLVRRA